MEPRDIAFEGIKVGDTASFVRVLVEKDVDAFAVLSGDYNPLHLDSSYAEKTIFKERIVHGMLTASLFSTLVGMYLPGKKCLYVSQSIFFKQPVYIDDTITMVGVVTSKSEVTRLLTISTLVKREEKIVVEGEARVRVL